MQINAGYVWAAISDFQGMPWHPMVSETSGENGNEIEATCEVTVNGEAVSDFYRTGLDGLKEQVEAGM